MNIFSVIPVFGRHELLPHTIGRLLTKCGVSKVYCIGDIEEDKRICTEAGAEWLVHPNTPLGAKWNMGIEIALESGVEYDGFLFMGSSDWVSNNWLDVYTPFLLEYDMTGTANCHFLDVNTNGKKRLVDWSGYTKLRSGWEAARSDEPIGVGRLYSMRIIKKLNGKLFQGDRNEGMDYISMKRVLDIGGTSKKFIATDTKSVSISTNKWINKHRFDNGLVIHPNSKIIEDVDGWLKEWFPEGFLVFKNEKDELS